MDTGLGLITKIVDEGKLLEVERQGITTEFLDDDTAPVFSYLQRYFREYKGIPSRDAVVLAFPNLKFAEHSEPLEYFIDEIKTSYRREVLENGLKTAAGQYVDSPDMAEDTLRQTLIDVQVAGPAHSDMDLVSSVDDILVAYQKKKEGPAVNGVPSGWAAMDNQTLGFQPEEFAVLVGEKWSGKSWILIYLALQALLHGERVLFNTSEMSTEEVMRRMVALYAHVPFDSLRRGELTNQEEERFKDSMDELKKSTYRFVIAREGVNTIDDIERKAIETDSTFILGDSIYLFAPDNSTYHSEPAKRIAISQKCKKVARRLGVPFIVSVQAGRKKSKKDWVPDIDNIEWSNAFSQDANTVFHIHRDETDKQLGRMQNWLLKVRDGQAEQFFINSDFEYMNFDQRSDATVPTTNIQFDDENEETYFGGE